MTKRAVLVLLLALGPASARAAVLTWEDCVNLALRRNPELGAARAGEAAARADYYGSYNGVLPRLSLSNSVSEGSEDRDASYNASGTASLTLLDLGTYARIRTAKAGAKRAAASLRDVSAEARLDLRRSFLQLLFEEENVGLSQRILQLRKHGAELVDLRYDSGRESKGNRMRARAQLLQAEAAQHQAGRDMESAKLTLSRRLGDETFEASAATGTLSSAAAPPPPDRLQSLADARPDVAASRAAVDSARAALASARSSVFPNLTANYTRGRTGPSEFPANRYYWSAGATLALPLFSGGPTQTYFNTSSAQRGVEQAQLQLQAARQSAVVDLQGVWADFAQADENLSVQSALLEAARQRNDEADVRYASGLLSFDNWELIVSDRVSQERAALQSRLSAATAEAAWDRALGKALGE